MRQKWESLFGKCFNNFATSKVNNLHKTCVLHLSRANHQIISGRGSSWAKGVVLGVILVRMYIGFLPISDQNARLCVTVFALTQLFDYRQPDFLIERSGVRIKFVPAIIRSLYSPGSA